MSDTYTSVFEALNLTPPELMAFDRAVLDSGDYFWQPWMVGYDWAPEHAPLPWTPRSQVAFIR